MNKTQFVRELQRELGDGVTPRQAERALNAVLDTIAPVSYTHLSFLYGLRIIFRMRSLPLCMGKWMWLHSLGR